MIGRRRRRGQPGGEDYDDAHGVPKVRAKAKLSGYCSRKTKNFLAVAILWSS